MKEESGEFEYYKGEPSPLEDVLFLCIAQQCDLVMDYHGTQFRRSTYEDGRSIRKNGFLPTYCPRHQRLYDYLKKEQERDEENQ